MVKVTQLKEIEKTVKDLKRKLKIKNTKPKKETESNNYI